MVANSAVTSPIIPPSARIPFVDKETGVLSTSGGLNVLQQMFTSINGLVPTLACDVAGSNVLTLTPVAISPQVIGYVSFLGMAFVAQNNSAGLVTAMLNLPTGTLDTLPVYKDRGATQAAAGDILQNRFYIVYYVDTLNSGNGGFVLT